MIQDNITVNIDIGWSALGAGTLGQTTYGTIQQDYSTVRAALNASAATADDHSAYAALQPGPAYSRLINHTTDSPHGANSATPYVNSLEPVMMTRANAKALGLLSGAGVDATVRMNSSVAFDFNPYDGVTPGRYDFATVGAHEIAHALGFISVVNYIEQVSGSAGSLPSSVLDLFRFSSQSLAAGAGYIDSTADARSKFFSVNGGATSVAPMATGAIYGTGYQADHWEAFYFVGLMDPFTPGGTLRLPRSADVRAMDLLGYRIPEPAGFTLLTLFSAALFFRKRLDYGDEQRPGGGDPQ